MITVKVPATTANIGLVLILWDLLLSSIHILLLKELNMV